MDNFNYQIYTSKSMYEYDDQENTSKMIDKCEEDKDISAIKFFLIFNIILTLIPSLFIALWTFTIFLFCIVSNLPQCGSDSVLQFVIKLLIFILWTVSIIFSIQGLIRKKLSRFNREYINLSFITVLIAVFWLFNLFFN